MFDGLAISHLLTHIHSALSPTPLSSALPVVVQNFKDQPTDPTILFWTRVAAGASAVAAATSIIAIALASVELSILARRARLNLTFPAQKSDAEIGTWMSTAPIMYENGQPVQGSPRGNKWEAQFEVLVHNTGKRTAPDALLRLAVPTDYSVSAATQPDPATFDNIPYEIFGIQISTPIYPKVGRRQSLQIARRTPVSFTGVSVWFGDLEPIKCYWQIGSPDGIDPSAGKWGVLTLKPKILGTHENKTDLLVTLDPATFRPSYPIRRSNNSERYRLVWYVKNCGFRPTSSDVRALIYIPAGFDVEPQGLKYANNEAVSNQAFQVFVANLTAPILKDELREIGLTSLVGSPGAYTFRWRLDGGDGLFPPGGIGHMPVVLEA